ncbi:glycerophosphoryl diester phosphodiesterase membrane domain-containing protein [Leuconostoc rapi]|uniref:glycerophosphoryl diester phosphodiesterase membrane domain-containing protein n=1 Tax=Leuconostoc rapi TaxID=1406906 RepID=UPI0019579F0A|nr:glycerophosphodiester phosphodiesterase [Leuconostoc rapi]MBM7436479.1 glycerophosphoryl diester phosphodiesterase [Leuconostoc rapi]
MRYIRLKMLESVKFLWRSKRYFKSVLAAHALFIFILLPTLGKASQLILKNSHINYLSINTLGKMMWQQPILFMALLGVVLSSMLLSFFEFAFLLISVYFIHIKQPVALHQLIFRKFTQIRKISISMGLFFTLYLMLILPLGGVSYGSDLLSKIKIPAFIMDYIFAHRLIIVGAFIVVYLLLTYIGVRFIFVLPNMIFNNLPTGEAIKSSLNLTRNRFFDILKKLAIIAFGTALFTSLSFAILIEIQKLVEQYSGMYTLVSAAIIMTILQIIILTNLALTTVGMFLVIVDDMSHSNALPVQEKKAYVLVNNKHQKFFGQLSAYLIFGILSVGIVAHYNLTYLKSIDISKPISASHRGVSEKNGVQNSIAALEKTAQYHPDYIEMDVQLTKDNQFVVFHDFNLKQLTGVNQTPANMNLKALTQLNVHENGQVAPIVSLDDYLKAANAIHQKLLIEFKTTDKNNTQLVQHFMRKYRDNLIENHHIIQSLNFELIEDAKTMAPNVEAGYILPFNIIGPPQSKADFYTVEFSTVNKHFIQASHHDGKKVFTWTPNDKKSILRMMYFGADGVVTDNMRAVNQATFDANHVTYSDKLLYYAAGVG